MGKNSHQLAGEINKHVAQRLRAARTMAQVSQETAGGYLGVSFQQMQKYEKGTNRIGPGALAVLAHAYGRPIGWFFEGAPDGLDRGSDSERPDVAAECLAAPYGAELLGNYLQLTNQDRRVVVSVAAALAGRAPARMPSAAG